MDGLERLIQFNNAYKDKKVLITGHTGFKGAWLCCWLHLLGAELYGISLPPDSTNVHYQRLNLPVNSYERDIRNLSKIKQIVQKIQPDIIFHLAAQPIVKDSYENPGLTFETNIMGTFNILEAIKGLNKNVSIINVTSDKVYYNNEWYWPYRETDRLGGHDPYSASKAMVELLSSSMRNSFFNINTYGQEHKILLSTVRAGNVIGGGDWGKHRIVPDIFRSVQKGNTVEIRNPEAIRPWQHVLEPLSGYLLLGANLIEEKKKFAKAWNFGPYETSNLTVRDLVDKMSKQWNTITYKELNYNGPHEAGLLKLDSSQAKHELGWEPVLNINETTDLTVNWYKEYLTNNKVITIDQINQYVQKALEKKHVWLKKK